MRLISIGYLAISLTCGFMGCTEQPNPLAETGEVSSTEALEAMDLSEDGELRDAQGTKVQTQAVIKYPDHVDQEYLESILRGVFQRIHLSASDRRPDEFANLNKSEIKTFFKTVGWVDRMITPGQAVGDNFISQYEVERGQNESRHLTLRSIMEEAERVAPQLVKGRISSQWREIEELVEAHSLFSRIPAAWEAGNVLETIKMRQQRPAELTVGETFAIRALRDWITERQKLWAKVDRKLSGLAGELRRRDVIAYDPSPEHVQSLSQEQNSYNGSGLKPPDWRGRALRASRQEVRDDGFIDDAQAEAFYEQVYFELHAENEATRIVDICQGVRDGMDPTALKLLLMPPVEVLNRLGLHNRRGLSAQQQWIAIHERAAREQGIISPEQSLRDELLQRADESGHDAKAMKEVINQAFGNQSR